MDIYQEILIDLTDKGISIGRISNGEHHAKCPQCSSTRKKQHIKCLSVKIDDVGYTCYCHHCNWTYGYKATGGSVSNVVKIVPDTTPDPVIEAVPTKNDEIYAELPAKVKKFWEKRGISEETLAFCGVYWDEDSKSIAFPYWEQGVISKIKHRGAGKKFWFQGNGNLVYYNLTNLKESGTVYIAEGEIDALSLVEAGFENVLSVPNGARQKYREEEDLEYVWRAEEVIGKDRDIVLCTDGDGPGKALAEELARRYGKERCYRIEYPEGCKDPNDIICTKGKDSLSQAVRDAAPYPISGVYSIDTYQSGVLDLYDEGQERGLDTGWRNLNEIFRVPTGQLIVVTGTPGSGKSEFIDALAVNMAVNHGWNWGVCSFENPPKEHITKLIEKYVGMPFWDHKSEPRMTKAQVAEGMLFLHKHFYMIRAEDEVPTIEWILERAKAAVVRYGIKGLIIDPYNEIESKRPDKISETEYISGLLSQVKRFAQNHGVCVFFIAHPAKMYVDRKDKYDAGETIPTMYNISGGAHWYNKSDIGITVHRVKTLGLPSDAVPDDDVMIFINKMRFKWNGKIGQVTMGYDFHTGRYYEK